MIKFKKNIEKHLPYDRENFLDFLSSYPMDGTPPPKTYGWYGVSIENNMFKDKDRFAKTKDITQFIDSYSPIIHDLILSLCLSKKWVINHVHPASRWLRKEEKKIDALRKIFQEKEVSKFFSGAIILSESEILPLIADLLSYPYLPLDDYSYYASITISNYECPLIIYIEDNYRIEAFSTDQDILDVLFTKNYAGFKITDCHSDV